MIFFNCRGIASVIHLLVCGSDPAGMVLSQTITAVSLGV